MLIWADTEEQVVLRKVYVKITLCVDILDILNKKNEAQNATL